MGKLFADIYAFHFSDENFCFFRHIHTCQTGDGMGRLAYDFRVQCSVDDNGLPYLFCLFSRKEIAASVCKFLFHCFIHLIQHDYRLFRCTDHTVVKGFGVDDGVHRQQNIGGIIDNCRGISCAYTYCRFSAGVCGFYHSRASCCQDDIRFLHNQVRHIQAWHINPADNFFRRSGCHCCFQYNFGCCYGAFLCTGVGANDDTVTGFQRQQALKDCC